jgi:vancomycin resistance protein VanJ
MARVFMADAEETGHGPRAGRAGAGRGGLTLPGRWGGAGSLRRGLLLAALALVLGLALALHAEVPNAVGNLGSLWETFLPWGGLLIPVLLVAAVLRRSATALVALLVPSVVWLNLFGGLFTDKTADGGDLRVVSHNVNALNADPAGTARQLASDGADLIALQEIAAPHVAAYAEELRDTHPYHHVEGTVGLWSAYPLSASRSVDTGIGWSRALRTTVAAPGGDIAVYAAHLPSVRVQFRSGFTAGQRDESARLLGDAIAGDRLERVVLLGDLNGTMNDRALAPVTAQMRSTQGAAGDGMGFTWPASFPLTRIDQIMVKGLEPVSSWTMAGTGSDHLPVAAALALP